MSEQRPEAIAARLWSDIQRDWPTITGCALSAFVQSRVCSIVEFERLSATEQERELVEALSVAQAHTAELGDAWQTGALSSCDGKNGLRSNRNWDVDNLLQRVLRLRAESRQSSEGQAEQNITPEASS